MRQTASAPGIAKVLSRPNLVGIFCIGIRRCPPVITFTRMKITAITLAIFLSAHAWCQLTPYEKSKGTETVTYFEAIDLYKQLDKASPKITVKPMGPTDAGYPLHLVLISNDGTNDPAVWHQKGKVVILINNGIHPGEPDGIDASILLARDIANQQKKLPDNIALAIIPVYNIGGSLNRGSYSRANQNGPNAFGFRGNAQNLDLNRDFTKADSYNARSFAQIFHFLQPDILIDNHVSDGADYQHVFTLLTTQYNKLGAPLGDWLRKSFEPALYKAMDKRGWKVFPYVNFDSYDLSQGMTQFFEAPRYSSGYAALFQTIGFVPETHMLKPYPERVKSTFDFMLSVIDQSAAMGEQLKQKRKEAKEAMMKANQWPLGWTLQKNAYDTVTFLGYERDTVTSEVTGLPTMQYNHQKPFSASVMFYSYFEPAKLVTVPQYYVIQQGWHQAIDRLKENKVLMRRILKDSVVTVTVYRIEEYKTSTRAFEKHYRQTEIKTSSSTQQIQLLAGDYIIPVQQPAKRYLIEMLEPTGDDGFFAWNYFDAILQQKEGYSNYRWETVAAQWLKANPALQQQLDEKKKNDPAFAKNSNAILNWVYKNSPYYEPVHLRHPVFRIE